MQGASLVAGQLPRLPTLPRLPSFPPQQQQQQQQSHTKRARVDPLGLGDDDGDGGANVPAALPVRNPFLSPGFVPANRPPPRPVRARPPPASAPVAAPSPVGMIPVDVPVAPSVPAPPAVRAQETGQVVLDTTAMIYDRVFAYYDVLATKESTERRLFTRHAAVRQPKGTGAKGLSGDKKVERLRHLLEHGFSDDRGRAIVRSKEQRELHETYIKVREIERSGAGRAWGADSPLRARHAWPSCTRTNGKTTASASSTSSGSRSSSRRPWSSCRAAPARPGPWPCSARPCSSCARTLRYRSSPRASALPASSSSSSARCPPPPFPSSVLIRVPPPPPPSPSR
jgi:hypothetical protein